MRRVAASFVLALVVVGCGSDTGFYDEEARAVARQAVGKGPFNGQTEAVSIESVTERSKCPQAPSPDAGPCLDVVIKSELTAQPVPGTHSAAAGAKLETSVDAFIWLTKSGGRWKVTHKTYRPRGVAVDGVPYSPSG
jgi:hypothetical protein